MLDLWQLVTSGSRARARARLGVPGAAAGGGCGGGGWRRGAMAAGGRKASASASASAYEWIECAHDAWTGATYAEFYMLLSGGLLAREQWCAYCTALAPALGAASHPAARWMKQQASSGAGAGAGRLRSRTGAGAVGAGARLASAVEGHAAAAWTLKVALYQAWGRAAQTGALRGVYAEAARLLSGEAAARDMTESSVRLDEALSCAGVNSRHAAKKAFDNAVVLLSAVLDAAILSGDEPNAVLCSCGRPGHQQAQCTFKSTLAPK